MELTVVCATFHWWLSWFPLVQLFSCRGFHGGLWGIVDRWRPANDCIFAPSRSLFSASQVGSFCFKLPLRHFKIIIFLRRFKMRLFRGAPFHEGLVSSYKMAEAKMVVRYWIVSAILAAFCLVALKLDNGTYPVSSHSFY